MLWVLTAVLLVVLALVALAVALLGMWRRLRAFAAALGRAAETVGTSRQGLTALRARPTLLAQPSGRPGRRR